MNERYTFQAMILLVILVLLLYRLIPEIIDVYRNRKARKQDEPYAYFEVSCETTSKEGERTVSDVNFKRVCNKIGLIIFLKELDDSIKETSDGKVGLKDLLEDVEKAEKEGALSVESADENS